MPINNDLDSQVKRVQQAADQFAQAFQQIKEIAGISAPEGMDWNTLEARLGELLQAVERLNPGETVPASAATSAGNGHPAASVEPDTAAQPATAANLAAAGSAAADARSAPLEKDLPLALNSLPDGFFLLDREFRFIFVNARAAGRASRGQNDLLGKTIWEEFPGTAGSVHEVYYRQVMDTRQSARFETPGVLANEWYEITVFPTGDGIGIFWQDISSRKQVEQAHKQLMEELQQARQQAERVAEEARGIARETRQVAIELESILNNLTDSVIVFDEHNRVRRTNSFAVAMLGFDPLHMSWDSVIKRIQVLGEDGRPLAAEDLPEARARRGEIVINLPLVLTNHYKRTYMVLASALPMFTGKTFTGVALLFKDITQRERLLQQLAAEHAWLDAVMEELPVGVWIADEQGRIKRRNAQAELIMRGVTSDLPLEMKDYQATYGVRAETGKPVTPDEWPLVRAVQEGYSTVGQELEIQRHDGSPATFLVSAAPVRDASGRQIGAVLVQQDISERKEAERALQESEQALRESENRFHLALENSPISVFSTDLDLRYTWVYNPTYANDPSQLIGKRDDELLSEEAAAELIAFKKSVLESGANIHTEVHVPVTGGMLTFLINAEPLRDEAGRVVGLVGAALDLSEQRRLELRQNEFTTQMEVQRRLLEQRESERQRIARELHDGPVQELIGVLFAIQAGMESASENEPLTTLGTVRGRLQELVGNLRQVCNELRPPSLMHFGLAQAIRSHAEDFRTRNTEITLVLDLMDDNRTLSDSTRLALYRIYQEGLTNAVRHARASQVTVRLALDPDRVVMDIEDNGCGMVTPIDWIDLARKDHLGLVGMKERAEATGGTLTVSSEPDKGTLIRVETPRRRG